MLASIIQARLGSHRLPRKSLMDICGKPMLGHVIDRVKKAVDNVIVATPDIEIVGFGTSQNISVFIGSEDDVLDRYYQTARAFGLTDVIRICADNPLVEPNLILDMIDIYMDSEVDYVSNNLVRTYPIGLDVEIFSFMALERAWKEAKDPYDREHVTPYIKDNLKVRNVWNEVDLSHLRWTVDYQEDLDFVRNIYSNLGGDFTMADVLEYLKGGKNGY